MKKGTKIFLIGLSSLLGIMIFGFVGGAIYLDKFLNEALETMETTETFTKEDVLVNEGLTDLEVEAKVINVALFGIDSRDNKYGKSDARADATKVVSLDLKNNKVKITSFQRDMMIIIPDESMDFDKLNHAYWYGGAPLALKTLNYNYDLDVSRYVTVNYDAVEFLVDRVGGVEIDVSEAERTVMNDYINDLNSIAINQNPASLIEVAGQQLLSGRQAVAYMRNRYVGSDYARMQRQTEVIIAAANQLVKMNVTEIMEVISECFGYVETNLTKQEIVDYTMSALKVDLQDIRNYQVPTNEFQDTMSTSYKGFSPLYVIRDYVEMVKDIHRNIYGNTEYEPTGLIYENHKRIHNAFGPWQ